MRSMYSDATSAGLYMPDNGISYDVYSLEMVVAVSFKLRSRESMAFRRFILGRLTMNNRQPVNIFFSLSPSRGKRAGN